MSPDKLIYMANQIGKFFAPQPEAEAVAGIANHIRKFWDPRMRNAMFAHMEHGGKDLEPLVLKAFETLRGEAAKAA
jgi:formate dehydrogenase subunit delta